MKTRIHINQHKVKADKRNDEESAVISCKTYKSNDYAKEVVIKGGSKIVYRPEKPLDCGAVLWVETEDGVEIIE